MELIDSKGLCIHTHTHTHNARTDTHNSAHVSGAETGMKTHIDSRQMRRQCLAGEMEGCVCACVGIVYMCMCVRVCVCVCVLPRKRS